MKPSVYDQIFKMKYGNRSEGYDPQNAVPKWDEDFEKLLADLATRKDHFLRVCDLYRRSQNPTLDVNAVFNDTQVVLDKISAKRFSVELESIIAHEALMIVYGIKICVNLLPFVKTGEDAMKFYKLYQSIHGMCLAIGETYKNDKRNFWHRYAFKIGLHLLSLTFKAKEVSCDFFEIDKGYGLYFKNHSGRGTNPMYFILPSISHSGSRDHNEFISGLVEKEVVRIIEKEIKK